MIIADRTAIKGGYRYLVVDNNTRFSVDNANGVIVVSTDISKRKINEVLQAIEVFEKEMSLYQMHDEYIERHRMEIINREIEARIIDASNDTVH